MDWNSRSAVLLRKEWHCTNLYRRIKNCSFDWRCSFNFGQYAYSDLNSGNLPDLVLGFKGIDGLTLNADDPDDVEKFYAIKAALVQYESERIDFQQLMVDALVAAGFTTDQIAAYIDE